MISINNKNKILLVQCYDTGALKSDFLFRNPMEYRDHLVNHYPEMERWADKETFNKVKEWPKELNIQFVTDEINVAGRFLAANIETPSKVIDKPITSELLINELKKDFYTHVGFTIISNDYMNFTKYSKTVKTFDPSIETIAGGTGAMFDGTERYVDHVCLGNGVPFLRNLLNENVNKPYNLVIMPDHARWRYLNQEIVTEQCRLVTKLGCPLNCDFCITPKLFNNEYTGEFFSPKIVHDALVNYKEKRGLNKLQIGFAEPTSVYSIPWWYEFFNLFKEDNGDFPIIIASPAFILKKLDLEKISNSAARFSYINIGIESFNKNYVKNRKVNMKALIKRLSDYGIGTYATYIIGFDFDTKESVWEDIKKLTNLDAAAYSVLNLHPHPMTDIWKQLASQNRLLNLPPDFYYIHAFQSYTHPHFKPGFKDIFPLLCDIFNFIETEKGNLALNIGNVFENLLQHSNNPKSIKREIRTLKSVSKTIYPSWKQFFNPSEVQDKNYLDKLK